MKRFVLCLILSLCLLTGTAFAAADSPYAIEVNRGANTVTIYEKNADGDYVPYKAMICSTARPGHVTPLGTYYMSSYRVPWCLMLDGSYGQYAVSFSGNYMFHSVCYSQASNDALLYEEYNDLGGPASMGCVRLQTEDAKWIYENCPAGTKVTVYDDPEDPGPLGKPEKKVDYITEETNNGWDPTDPAEGNPWTMVPAETLYLNRETLELTAGEGRKLIAYIEPEEATNRWVTWETSDPDVAEVDRFGKVIGLRAGVATITASCRDGFAASCQVTVTGELLSYGDLVPGQWYYPSVREALSRGIMDGMGDGTFSPDAPMTRGMLAQILYQQAGKPEVRGALPFSDVKPGDWYEKAVLWANQKGLVRGDADGNFHPEGALTRQDLFVILWRQAGCPAGTGSLSAFADGRDAADYAGEALVWAVSQGLVQGSGGRLDPGNTATRAQAAAIFTR